MSTIEIDTLVAGDELVSSRCQAVRHAVPEQRRAIGWSAAVRVRLSTKWTLGDFEDPGLIDPGLRLPDRDRDFRDELGHPVAK